MFFTDLDVHLSLGLNEGIYFETDIHDLKNEVMSIKNTEMKVSIWGFKMRLVWLIYDIFWQNCSISKVTMRKNCITFGRLRRQIYGVLNSVSRKTRIHKIIKNTDSKVENNSFKMRHFWALHDYFWPSWAHDTCFFYTLYLYSTSLHKTVYQFLFSNTTI